MFDSTPSNELFLRYRQDGCQDSFTALFARHDQPLKRWLGRRFPCLDVGHIDDVAQDAWMAAADRDGTPVSNFESWLFSVATNSALKIIQQQRLPRFVSLAALQNVPFESDSLNEFLVLLTSRERPVFLLLYCLGFTFRKTASCLEMEFWTVKSLATSIKSKIGELC